MSAYSDKTHFEIEQSFEKLIEYSRILYYKDITVDMVNMWEKYFSSAYEYNNYIEFETTLNLSKRMKCYEYDPNDVDVVINRSIVNKVYQKTIDENYFYFTEILRLAYEINPDIKIYAMIIPRYGKIYENAQPYMQKQKEIFYDLVQKAKKEYAFEFLDLSNHELSKETKYYYDESHFNFYGASKFTEWINNNILI